MTVTIAGVNQTIRARVHAWWDRPGDPAKLVRVNIQGSHKAAVGNLTVIALFVGFIIWHPNSRELTALVSIGLVLAGVGIYTWIYIDQLHAEKRATAERDRAVAVIKKDLEHT